MKGRSRSFNPENERYTSFSVIRRKKETGEKKA